MRPSGKQLGLVALIVFSCFAWGCGGIHNAARTGDTDQAKRLLEKGDGINTKDSSGRTPLMIAARNKHTDLVKLLINKGADVNARDNDGGTALIFTILWPVKKDCGIEIVNMLIDNGADIDAADKNGTALQYALDRKEEECGQVVDLLINKSVKVPSGFATLLFPVGTNAFPSRLDFAWHKLIKGGINLSPGHRSLTVGYAGLFRRVWGEPIDINIHVESGGIYILKYEIDLGKSIWMAWIKKYK